MKNAKASPVPSGAPDAPAPTIEKLTGYVGDGIHYRLPKSRQSAHLAHDLTTLNFNAWPRAKGTLVTAEVVELFQVVGLLPLPPEGAQPYRWEDDPRAVAFERFAAYWAEHGAVNAEGWELVRAVREVLSGGLRVPQSAPEPVAWAVVSGDGDPREANSIHWPSACAHAPDFGDAEKSARRWAKNFGYAVVPLFAAPPSAPAPTPQIDEQMVEAVEREVGMGRNAWDMVDPRIIIAAVLNVVQGSPHTRTGEAMNEFVIRSGGTHSTYFTLTDFGKGYLFMSRKYAERFASESLALNIAKKYRIKITRNDSSQNCYWIEPWNKSRIATPLEGAPHE